MLINIVTIGFASILGANLRYLFMLFFNKFKISKKFPFAILITNVLGSLLIGFSFKVSSELFSFFFASLGGFTTFSTFITDIYYLLNKKKYCLAILYFLASILLSLILIYVVYSL